MSRHFSLVLFVGVAGAVGLHVRPCIVNCTIGEAAFASHGSDVAVDEAPIAAGSAGYEDSVTYEDGNDVEQSMASVETALETFVDDLAREGLVGGPRSAAAGGKIVPAVLIQPTPAATFAGTRAASQVVRPDDVRPTSSIRAARPSFGELQLAR